eukprot:15463381-Alexandrium_andersonii.AAC.1
MGVSPTARAPCGLVARGRGRSSEGCRASWVGPEPEGRAAGLAMQHESGRGSWARARHAGTR